MVDQHSVNPDQELDDVVDDVIEEEDQNGETEQGQEDWEARFKGLQGRLQQEVEARRYSENEKLQLEARLLQASVQDLSPQDQQAAMMIWQNEQKNRMSQQQTAQSQAQMNEVARVFVTQQLSTKYGVPVKELSQFPDPHSMEAHAKLVSQQRRSQAKEKRKTEKKDNFGSGGSGTPTPKRQKAESIREARRSFAEAAKRMQQK